MVSYWSNFWTKGEENRSKILELKLPDRTEGSLTMIPDTAVFGFTLIDTGAVLFLLIYFVSFAIFPFSRPDSKLIVEMSNFQVLILSDLECDYINAQQCCSKLNFWSIPKVSAHVLVTLILLVSGHWVLFLVNIPFVGYLLYEYKTIPRGNIGIFDPCEIHVSGPRVQSRNAFESHFSVSEPRTNQEAYEYLHDIPRILSTHLLRIFIQVSHLRLLESILQCKTQFFF